MQEITIDCDAVLDADVEYWFFSSLKDVDPFQPHLTQDERSELVVGDCGEQWPLTYIAKRVNDYWTADD